MLLSDCRINTAGSRHSSTFSRWSQPVTRLPRLPCWWGGEGRGQRGGTADTLLLHYLLSDSTDGTPTEILRLTVMTKEFCIPEHQRVESVWNNVHLYCTWYDVDGTRGNPNSRGTQVPLERHTLSFVGFFFMHTFDDRLSPEQSNQGIPFILIM